MKLKLSDLEDPELCEVRQRHFVFKPVCEQEFTRVRNGETIRLT